MKSFTCISQSLDDALTSAQNLHCGTTIFAERLLMTASAFKHDPNIIIIKAAESLKLFWCEEVAGRWIEIKYYIIYWKSFPSFPIHRKKFSFLFLVNLVPQQILSFLFCISLCEINCIKIEKVLAEVLCVLFTLRHHSPATEKNVHANWTFFQSRKRNKNIWSCAKTNTGHAQISYLTVARLSVA